MTTPVTDYASVDSSALKTLYYDEDTRNLYVKFHSGQVAGYQGVERALYNEFKNAPSVGSFYTRWIKPAFKGVDTNGFKPVMRTKQPVTQPAVSTHTHQSDSTQKKFTFEVTYRVTETATVEATDFNDAAVKVRDGNTDINILKVEVKGA